MKRKKMSVVQHLRESLGMPQKQFMDVIGRTLDAVRSLECGRLALSQSLAAEIAVATGISLEWLMAGDATKPMTSQYGGGPYSKAVFDRVQAQRRRDKNDVPSMICLLRDVRILAVQMLHTLLEAWKSQNSELCAFKMMEAMDAVREQLNLPASARKEWLCDDVTMEHYLCGVFQGFWREAGAALSPGKNDDLTPESMADAMMALDGTMRAAMVRQAKKG